MRPRHCVRLELTATAKQSAVTERRRQRVPGGSDPLELDDQLVMVLA